MSKVEYNVVRLPSANKKFNLMLLSLEQFEYDALILAQGKGDKQFMANSVILPIDILIGAFDIHDIFTKEDTRVLATLMGTQELIITQSTGKTHKTMDNVEILLAAATRLIYDTFAIVNVHRTDEIELIEKVGRPVDILNL